MRASRSSSRPSSISSADDCHKSGRHGATPSPITPRSCPARSFGFWSECGISLFCNGSLSSIGPGWFLMFPRLPVIGCRPFFQSRAKRFLRYRPCRPTSFPSGLATLFSGGLRSSVSPDVIVIAINAPLWFITTCSLTPEDPSHRRTPARGQILEHPVAAGARVGADRQSGAVGDMDAGLFAGNRNQGIYQTGRAR